MLEILSSYNVFFSILLFPFCSFLIFGIDLKLRALYAILCDQFFVGADAVVLVTVVSMGGPGPAIQSRGTYPVPGYRRISGPSPIRVRTFTFRGCAER